MFPSDGSIPAWLAVAAFVFGYIWAANARMDVVWDQGYEAGIRQLFEACGEEPGSGVPPAQARWLREMSDDENDSRLPGL